MGSITYFDWFTLTFTYLSYIYIKIKENLTGKRRLSIETTVTKQIGLHIIQPLLFEIPLFGRNSAVGRCSDVIYKGSNGTDISNC